MRIFLADFFSRVINQDSRQQYNQSENYLDWQVNIGQATDGCGQRWIRVKLLDNAIVELRIVGNHISLDIGASRQSQGDKRIVSHRGAVVNNDAQGFKWSVISVPAATRWRSYCINIKSINRTAGSLSIADDIGRT